VRRILT